jgi:phosphate transport system protein
MNFIFVRENEMLKESILRLAGEVEQRLSDVLKSVERRDKAELLKIIEMDEEIDEREVLIEEECLKILALHQPVARDLRFVIAVLKINNDLERVGDIVVNIADRGARLTAFPVSDLQEKILQMGRLARAMLKDSLDALIALDVVKASDVIGRDDEVDKLNVEVIGGVIARAAESGSGAAAEPLILIHSMARDIERIGDHATNIAEDVAYLVDGTIIRHRRAGLC